MRIRPASAAAAFALSTLAVSGFAAPAVAQAPVCDPYSASCPTPPPQNVVRDIDCPGNFGPARPGDGSAGGAVLGTSDEECPTTTTTSTTTSSPATLPFTGGELVLLTAVGAGALAGGVVLVAAGRRRKPDVA